MDGWLSGKALEITAVTKITAKAKPSMNAGFFN